MLFKTGTFFLGQQVKPGEPLYAQVNREKKKNRGPGKEVEGVAPGPGDMWGYEEGKGLVVDGHGHMAAPAPPGGDSWV